MEKQPSKVWLVIVPKKLDTIVEEAIKKSTFRTKSEFIRFSAKTIAEKLLEEEAGGE